MGALDVARRAAGSSAPAEDDRQAALDLSGDPAIGSESGDDSDDTAEGGGATQESEVELLRRELAEARVAIGRLEGASTARAEAERTMSAEPERDLTRAELRQAIDAGTMTEERADEILEAQMERRIATRTQQSVAQQLNLTQSQARIQTDIDRYLERMPDLAQKSGANWDRVAREYRYLTGIGAPHGAATELAALRSAFGPAERIPEKTRETRERSEESLGSGSGSESESGARGGRGWTKGLNARQITHYQGQLDKGAYSGIDDPRFMQHIAVARGEDPRKVVERARAARAPRAQPARGERTRGAVH